MKILSFMKVKEIKVCSFPIQAPKIEKMYSYFGAVSVLAEFGAR